MNHFLCSDPFVLHLCHDCSPCGMSVIPSVVPIPALRTFLFFSSWHIFHLFFIKPSHKISRWWHFCPLIGCKWHQPIQKLQSKAYSTTPGFYLCWWERVKRWDGLGAIFVPHPLCWLAPGLRITIQNLWHWLNSISSDSNYLRVHISHFWHLGISNPAPQVKTFTIW